jgi:hypothetical protein
MAPAFPTPATVLPMEILFPMNAPKYSIPYAMDTRMPMGRTGRLKDAIGVIQIFLVFKSITKIMVVHCGSALSKEEHMDHAFVSYTIHCVKRMATIDPTRYVINAETDIPICIYLVSRVSQ